MWVGAAGRHSVDSQQPNWLAAEHQQLALGQYLQYIHPGITTAFALLLLAGLLFYFYRGRRQHLAKLALQKQQDLERQRKAEEERLKAEAEWRKVIKSPPLSVVGAGGLEAELEEVIFGGSSVSVAPADADVEAKPVNRARRGSTWSRISTWWGGPGSNVSATTVTGVGPPPSVPNGGEYPLSVVTSANASQQLPRSSGGGDSPRTANHQQKVNTWRQTFMSTASVGEIISKYKSIYSTTGSILNESASDLPSTSQTNNIGDHQVDESTAPPVPPLPTLSNLHTRSATSATQNSTTTTTGAQRSKRESRSHKTSSIGGKGRRKRTSTAHTALSGSVVSGARASTVYDDGNSSYEGGDGSSSSDGESSFSVELEEGRILNGGGSTKEEVELMADLSDREEEEGEDEKRKRLFEKAERERIVGRRKEIMSTVSILSSVGSLVEDVGSSVGGMSSVGPANIEMVETDIPPSLTPSGKISDDAPPPPSTDTGQRASGASASSTSSTLILPTAPSTSMQLTTERPTSSTPSSAPSTKIQRDSTLSSTTEHSNNSNPSTLPRKELERGPSQKRGVKKRESWDSVASSVDSAVLQEVAVKGGLTADAAVVGRTLEEEKKKSYTLFISLPPKEEGIGKHKLFEKTDYFDHSWATLTMANWRKYPNDYSKHVLSVDILSRQVDPKTGILRTERLICCKQSAPSLLRRMGLPIPEVAYFREISELDPKERHYTAKSVNLSMRSIMSVTETCIFRELASDDIQAGVSSLEEAALNSPEAERQTSYSLRTSQPSVDSSPLSSSSSSDSSTTLFSPMENTTTTSSPSLQATQQQQQTFSPSSKPTSNWSLFSWIRRPSVLHNEHSIIPTAAPASIPTPTASQSTPTPTPAPSPQQLSNYPFSKSTSTLAPPSTSMSSTQTPSCITQFIQRAEFHGQGFASVARLVEEMAVSRFQQNAEIGRKALESVIAKVVEEASAMEARTMEVLEGGMRYMALEAEAAAEATKSAATAATEKASKWRFRW
ncbi:hypothetical protein HDV05_008734 [Chytridiales sp. JEL 0842]|nr:hypothetical protein HDV05_008734 [Chytridiales sp. JEL 0842]